MKMYMKTEESEDEYVPLEEGKTFVRIYRQLKIDCIERKITSFELLIFFWLSLLANPHNGIIKTSYEEIVSDLGIIGKSAKNRVNKVMTSLKRKQYIYYPRQQGRRSSFHVQVGNYQLSSNIFKDISHHFNSDGCKGEDKGEQLLKGNNADGDDKKSKSKTNKTPSEQKLRSEKGGTTTVSSKDSSTGYSRSTDIENNKDKDNNNHKVNKSPTTFKEKLNEMELDEDSEDGDEVDA